MVEGRVSPQTHRHADIEAWLAKNRRVTLHFTPTSGTVAAIETFINGWNERCHPFVWTKTADEILPHTRKRDSDARH